MVTKTYLPSNLFDSSGSSDSNDSSDSCDSSDSRENSDSSDSSENSDSSDSTDQKPFSQKNFYFTFIYFYLKKISPMKLYLKLW